MPANLKVNGDYTSPRVNCEEDFFNLGGELKQFF